MNATGTERQRAVIAAYLMRPDAKQREIAQAAGVPQQNVSTIIRDYLESKERDDACLPVRTTSKPAEKDVACFAVDRRLGCRFDADVPFVSHTVKQQNTRIALAENPRAEGETKMKYCRRIGAMAGVSPGCVHLTMEMLRCEQIGAALRAKQAAEAGTKLVPFSVGKRLETLERVIEFCLPIQPPRAQALQRQAHQRYCPSYRPLLMRAKAPSPFRAQVVLRLQRRWLLVLA